MSYCINPECHHRQNLEDVQHCMTCHTPLILYRDRFRILEKISTSNALHAWEVFKVIDTHGQHADRYKVLKTLKNSSSLHKELFEREKTALRNLRHSGIPAYIVDFVLPAEKGRPELDCLVMELIEGQDLSKWVEFNKLSDNEKALKWLRKITTILSYIHSKKYFHRDIKPGNIMLKSNEELSLIDYGIARETTDTVYEKGASTKAFTLAYAAPEQINGAAVPQSDFYALGKTFVHLLTGMPPDSEKLDFSRWEFETDFPTSGIIPLLKWMLKENPNERPRTPEKIIEIIDYVSCRKPDGNFPTARDTEMQIKIKNGELPKNPLLDETTILPAKDIVKPLIPNIETVLPLPDTKLPKTNSTESPRLKIPKKLRIIYITLPIFLMAAGTVLIATLLRPKLEEACNSTLGDRISCGEEILLPETSKGLRKNKESGAQAIAAGDYAKAIELLKKDFEATADPETLIMWENAKLANSSILVRNVAVTIPGSSSTPQDIPTAMLKAVSFAQKEWNSNLDNKWKLRLVLVDDQNNENSSVALVNALLKRNIYAGVGSYSSKVTTVTKNVYKDNKTVLVSGTSTADTLTNFSLDTFFFRACPNNEKSARKIANYLREKQYKKIAIFRTEGEVFSDSLTKALEENIGKNVVAGYFDFMPNGLAENKIKEAKKLGAQAIILFPGAYAGAAPERDRAISIIRENKGELPIIGNEIVKDQTLLSLEKNLLQNLVIAIPWWHSPKSVGKETVNPPKYWGNIKQLDHRIALNYDAIEVVIKALDKLPITQNEDIVEIRQKIQKTLSAPEFKIDGYTEKVSFMGSDRRELTSTLIKPLCNESNKCQGFVEVP